jgi:hypothetical protein
MHSYLSTGVSLDASLPLSWEPLPESSRFLMAQWATANTLILKNLTLLDTYNSETATAAVVGNEQWAQLETKVDLALQLLVQLYGAQHGTPASHAIALTNDTLRWHTEKPPAHGSELLARLYLSPKLPLPILLPCRVRMVEAHEQHWWVSASLEITDTDMQDWLEKTIFRHHRRAIQQQRRPKGA